MTPGDLGFDFQVISPTRVVLKERVNSLIIPGARGAIGFWPGHAPMLVTLSPGVVKYRPVGEVETKGFRLLAVGGGFFEVSPDGRGTLLADSAELPDEIDVARARASYERAKRRLARPSRDLDMLRAEISLQRAMARLRVAGQA